MADVSSFLLFVTSQDSTKRETRGWEDDLVALSLWASRDVDDPSDVRKRRRLCLVSCLSLSLQNHTARFRSSKLKAAVVPHRIASKALKGKKKGEVQYTQRTVQTHTHTVIHIPPSCVPHHPVKNTPRAQEN